MIYTKSGELQMSTKKVWTAPAVTIIELNSARNGSATHGDGSGAGKS